MAWCPALRTNRAVPYDTRNPGVIATQKCLPFGRGRTKALQVAESRGRPARLASCRTGRIRPVYVPCLVSLAIFRPGKKILEVHPTHCLWHIQCANSERCILTKVSSTRISSSVRCMAAATQSSTTLANSS